MNQVVIILTIFKCSGLLLLPINFWDNIVVCPFTRYFLEKILTTLFSFSFQHRLDLVNIVYSMAIMWIAMTYSVDRQEKEVHFYIRHNVDAVLSFRVALEPIAVDYHTHTDREDFTDGCLMIITVMHVTTSGVCVSLTWT